jgi:hypothetical protein
MSPLPDITLHSLQAFFERSPGLVRITTYAPYLMVFEDPGASLFRYVEAPMLVPLPSPGPLFTGYAFHSALNQTPALLPPSSTGQGYTLRQAHDNISQSTYLLYPYNYIYGGYPVHFYASEQMDYSPSQGVLPLGSNWYFEGFGGNLTYGSKAGNMTVSAATARPVSADLSYGDFVSPGHVGIPIPNGTGVNITWRFAYESGNPEGSVSTSVFANNDSWQTMGGSEVFSATLSPAQKFMLVNESVVITPGCHSFDVIFQMDNVNNVTINSVNITYSLFTEKSVPVVVKIPIWSETGGAYSFTFALAGTGSLNLGTEALNVSASKGTELERAVTLSPGRPISVVLRDLSVSYLLVIPMSVSNRSSLPDSNAFGAYDPISGTITLSPPQRNSTLVIALYGWELDGVSPIAVSLTGQTLYQVVGGAPLTAHVAGAFVLNLAQIIGAALLYAGIVIAFGLFLRPHPLARYKPRLGNRASP